MLNTVCWTNRSRNRNENGCYPLSDRIVTKLLFDTNRRHHLKALLNLFLILKIINSCLHCVEAFQFEIVACIVTYCDVV